MDGYVWSNDNTLPQYDRMDEEGKIINLGWTLDFVQTCWSGLQYSFN
jgi:hypothetical protein